MGRSRNVDCTRVAENGSIAIAPMNLVLPPPLIAGGSNSCCALHLHRSLHRDLERYKGSPDPGNLSTLCVALPQRYPS